MLENDDNAVRLLDPRAPPAGKFRAQWNDDFHHAWHVLLSGETHGYYRDHAAKPLTRIARMLPPRTRCNSSSRAISCASSAPRR